MMAYTDELLPDPLGDSEEQSLSSEFPLSDNIRHKDLPARIADPSTPIKDAIELTRIHGELTRIEEHRKDLAHLRQSENRQFYSKMAFSGGAVLTGIGFASFGLAMEGFALIGVGLYWLAPDFVKSIYGRFFGAGGGGEECRLKNTSSLGYFFWPFSPVVY